MKIKHLLLSAIAVATALVSCQKDLSKETASISLSDSVINFESTTDDTKTITLTSTRVWQVEIPEAAAKWIGVSPDKGEASADPQTIEITVKANAYFDRSAKITFKIVGGSKELTVNQKGDKGAAQPGDGTAAHPYSVAEARAEAAKLALGSSSQSEVYVKGIVHKIKAYDSRYTTINFYISDDGTSKDDFTMFSTYSFNGGEFKSQEDIDAVLKVNDVVVVCGKIKNHDNNGASLLEMTFGKLISVNGVGPEVETTSAEGLVVALTAKAIVIKTADGYAYAFSKNGISDVAVGDYVKAKGTSSTYAGISQIENPTIDVQSSGNAVEHPTPTIIGADNIEGFSNALEYVRLTGTMIKSGNYYNISIPGSSKQGSLSYPAVDYSSFDKSMVDVEGYFVGWTSGNTYFNIATVNIAASSAKYFTVEKSEISVDAKATSATIKVQSNVAWSVISETEGFTVSPASGENSGEVTVSFAENTNTENAITATIKITTNDTEIAEADRTKTVTIIQGKALSANAQVIELSAENDLKDKEGFPQAKGSYEYAEYDINGFTWGFAATSDSGYYYYSSGNAILVGKKGAYIQMPAIEGKSLTKVSVLTAKDASAKVTVGIYDTSDNLVTGGGDLTLGKGTTHDWNLSGTSVNTNYRIKVTNANNSQFQTITLVYE